jgi:hypothetical protein
MAAAMLSLKAAPSIGWKDSTRMGSSLEVLGPSAGGEQQGSRLIRKITIQLCQR